MRKLSVLAMSAILITTLSSCTLLYPNWGKPTNSPTKTETGTPQPTDTDTGTPTTEPTNKANASVEIMDAYVDTPNGILQVIAQITNFSEDGGTCTLTFTGGGKTATVSGKAESNAANTQCAPLELALGQLPRGSGSVTVTYDSATKHGVSPASAVTIQ